MGARRDEATSQQERFAVYLDRMAQAAGHADRIVPMQNYVKGLLLPLERKSVEPMAARLAPGNVRQTHESLHHIVAEAAWSVLLFIWTEWRRPPDTPIALFRCRTMLRACCCPSNARVSSRWRRGWLRETGGRCISRCITLWRRRPGAMRQCWPRFAVRCCLP